MLIMISFKSGGEFVWRNVKASEVEAVAVDIKDLAEKGPGGQKSGKTV